MNLLLRILIIPLFVSITMEDLAGQSRARVPGDHAVLRKHAPHVGLFGPRKRKEVDLGAEALQDAPYTADVPPAQEEPIAAAALTEAVGTASEVIIHRSPAAAALRGLRAVLVVGPSDHYTSQFIGEVEDAAVVLRSRGVETTCFYHPKAKWADIVQAARGADIFIYSGHGVFYDRRERVVGGLALSDGIVDPEAMQQGLDLRPGAVVLFTHVCYTAGSASNDYITLSMAHHRVVTYATPFFLDGVGAYLASNLEESMAKLVEQFLDGEPLDGIGIVPMVSTKPFDLPKRGGLVVRIHNQVPAKTRFGHRSNDYDQAYVGPAGFTIHQLLQGR
jgi:hypothetical protein